MRRIAAALVAVMLLSPAAVLAEAPQASPFKVRDVTGETLELSALLEQGPVLLDFWATWCKPCILSLPEIEKLHQSVAGRGVTVIGVSIDGPRNQAKVRPFVQRLGLTYPIVIDEDGRVQARYQVRAVPTSILIARDGTIRRVTQGYRPGEVADLEAAVIELLGEKDAAAE